MQQRFLANDYWNIIYVQHHGYIFFLHHLGSSLLGDGSYLIIDFDFETVWQICSGEAKFHEMSVSEDPVYCNVPFNTTSVDKIQSKYITLHELFPLFITSLAVMNETVRNVVEIYHPSKTTSLFITC